MRFYGDESEVLGNAVLHLTAVGMPLSSSNTHKHMPKCTHRHDIHYNLCYKHSLKVTSVQKTVVTNTNSLIFTLIYCNTGDNVTIISNNLFDHSLQVTA